MMDNLEYVWSGKYPENRSPHINSLKIDGKAAIENVYLQPGKAYDIMADIVDPDNDKLTYHWQILESEFGLTGTGGDAEVTPDPMKINLAEKMEVARHDNEFLIVENKNQFRFKSPLKPGAYRFFVYAYDGNGNAATANIPFYVRR